MVAFNCYVYFRFPVSGGHSVAATQTVDIVDVIVLEAGDLLTESQDRKKILSFTNCIF